ELLLVAIAGCSGMDVDHLIGKRVDPERFDLHAQGNKVRDEGGNHLTNLHVTFDVGFPAGDDGDAALARLPHAIQQSDDRLCTVSRTVQLGTPIAMDIAE
ncbi:OsmC family protein, partial [Aeromicrobium sp.]